MTFAQFITFLLVGIGLCFDTFAVSVSFGVLKKEIQFRQACSVAFVLAFVQTLFPVVGWLIGLSVKNLITSVDHWLAFGLLALIGGRMIFEGIRKEEERKEFDPTKILVLLGMAVATSIDSLVVGLSFGFLSTSILAPAIIIGGVTFLAAMLGMLFGKNIPGKTSHRSLILGGIILILIGAKILVEHLMG
jgi:manganese efflux pump family protein